MFPHNSEMKWTGPQAHPFVRDTRSG
jgi:hypothetical protein